MYIHIYTYIYIYINICIYTYIYIILMPAAKVRDNLRAKMHCRLQGLQQKRTPSRQPQKLQWLACFMGCQPFIQKHTYR